MFLKSILGGVVIATGLTLSTTGAVAEQPALKRPDIAEMLKRKMLRRPIRRYGRQVYGRANVSSELRADLVVLSVGLKANGDNAGNTVIALDAKKKSIIDAIKTSGFEVSKTQVSNLRVYNRRRSSYVNGQRKNATTFEGSMSIDFVFQASDDVLADVAKIAGDRVTSINSMRYKFSKQALDSAVTELKAKALDQATRQAKAKAKSQNKELGVLMSKTATNPYNRGQRGATKRTMLLQVTARVTYQTK